MAALGNQCPRGDAEMAQAAKALKTSFSFFSAKESRLETAFEHFERAGNLYKASSCWDKAAEAYTQAADTQRQLNEESQLASMLNKAGDSHRKAGNYQGAVSVWREAIDVYVGLGRGSSAANIQSTIAEIYEQGHLGEANSEDTIKAYLKAAELFVVDTPGRPQAANNCKEKAAYICMNIKQYDKADELFMDLAESCMRSNLLKFNAKGYYFRSLICLLGRGDVVKTRTRLNEIETKDTGFRRTREKELVEGLSTALVQEDKDAFGQACMQFESIRPMEQWMVSVLLEAKRQIPEPPPAPESESESEDEPPSDNEEPPGAQEEEVDDLT